MLIGFVDDNRVHERGPFPLSGSVLTGCLSPDRRASHTGYNGCLCRKQFGAGLLTPPHGPTAGLLKFGRPAVKACGSVRRPATTYLGTAHPTATSTCLLR